MAVRVAAVLTIVVAICVGLMDVCKACPVCETPSTPVYHPPKTPTYKAPPVYYSPPKTFVGAPPPPKTCPVSLVQLSVCTPLLGGILSGTSKSCCALLNLLGVEANVCLCLAVDANILGIPINAKLDVIASIFLDCGYKAPKSLSCPSY